MRIVALAFMAGLSVAAASAVALAQPDASLTPRNGADLWRASCGYCHGGPMNAPELRGRRLPTAVIRQFVRHGAPGMPPFHPSALSEQELEVLAQWIAAEPAPEASPQ